MEGGQGSDVYYVDAAGDSVIEAADGGNDAVFSTISYTLGATVESLILLGSNNLNGQATPRRITYAEMTATTYCSASAGWTSSTVAPAATL